MPESIGTGWLAYQQMMQGRQELGLRQQDLDLRRQLNDIAIQKDKQESQLLQLKQRKMQQLMSLGPGGQPPTPEAMADRLYAAATEMADIAPVEAGKLAEAASQLMEKTSQARKFQGEAETRDIAQLQEVMSGVTPDTWSQRAANAMMILPNLPPAIKEKLKGGYDPGLVDTLKSWGESKLKVAQAANISARTAGQAIIDALHIAQRDRQEALAKNAGTEGKEPKTSTITDVTTRVAKFGDVPKDKIRDIAADAESRGGDIKVAVKEAIEEAKARGVFAGLTPKRVRVGTAAEKPFKPTSDEILAKDFSFVENKFYEIDEETSKALKAQGINQPAGIYVADSAKHLTLWKGGE